MGYKTKFVQDLCTTNTEIYEEVLQFVLNENRFFNNVQNLRKSSLEALVYMLLVKQRGKLPNTMLGSDKFNLQSIVTIIDLNHLRLQQDSETFRWVLSALTLMVLIEKDDQSVRLQLEAIVNVFDRDFHELPIYYDVLRTLLILGKENPELAFVCSGLDGERMVRRLASESTVIRMKALACLQTMMEFNAGLYNQWLHLLQDSKIMIESKVFILYQLMETLLRLGDRSNDILQTLQTDHVWLICIEGFANKDPVCRKETLAFVQYAIRYAKQCDQKLDGQYFHWSPEAAESAQLAWLSFVTIVEALNESQTHLILPALELIVKVDTLHNVWKNVLLRLILLHENVRVVNHGLYYFLKNRSFDPMEAELEKQFLETFNRMAVFENVPEMITHLTAYYNARESFAFLLQTIPDIGWNSIPYYCISSVIYNVINEIDTISIENHLSVQSITGCVKICHDIKNVSLRYITFALLLKSIPQFLVQMRTGDSSLTLLTVVKEIEKLSSVFTMSLEQFQDAKGTTFCDWITTDALMKYLEKVTVKDTFLIEQLLVKRISKIPTMEQDQMLDKLFHTNQPVYLNVLEKLPELQITRIKRINEVIQSTMSTIMKAEETNQKIASSTFSILAQMISLMRSSSEGKCLNDWHALLAYMRSLVSTRLASFDYTQSVAIETIQLTWLFVVRMKDNTLAEKFSHSVSLKALKDSFRRHQTTEPPSIDEVYGMITEIYLSHSQSQKQSQGAFASEEDWSKLISLLDVGNIHVLTLVLEILYTETGSGEDAYDAGRLAVVDRCYKEILNYRKSDHFMKLMEKFLEMLMMPYIRVTDQTEQDTVEIHSRVTEYITMFLEQANTIYGLANIVFETIFQVPVAIILNWGSFGKLLLQGMIFGDVPKRDQKLECDVVDQCGIIVPFKQHFRYQAQADARVRVLCVQFLYRIVKANHPDAVLFLLKLERMLIERFTQITKAKERYYADSITHRQKLRIVQALCVVLKLTGTKPYPLLEIMLYETNQPNINYLIELIVADSGIDTLTIANSLRNEKVKVSGIQSVFVILWLRCCQTNVLDEQYVYLLLPWTMAQNFSTRLYAQITIKKLIAKFSPAPLDEGPYKELYAAVNSYLRQGNVERNIEKCMKDFRFNSVFDYCNLLTMENIFHNIPKVSGAPVEDIVGTTILRECFQTLDLGDINLGHALEFEELQTEKHENLFLAQSVGGTEFVQRKIVPLKSLEPNQDLLLGLPQHLCAKKMDSTEGMIVIASLVNRAPNLGGLARTSEIFAVKQLIINSLQDIDNKEFKALSMTAEKWLNVGELKAHKIVEYLEEMKAKGYAIVGAEQTTGSKPIQQLQFPKKCILVLGHEKNGLPAEIIRHLDLIGEIPQFGVVRSLNVHVTGAIFMWEYVKQHQVATEL
uniref:SpoU_methylase domain-containing protein n=1 Tax=Anopheles funestus TaxID=62324 RepID=A0A4Y0BDV6_ANOFN